MKKWILLTLFLIGFILKNIFCTFFSSECICILHIKAQLVWIWVVGRGHVLLNMQYSPNACNTHWDMLRLKTPSVNYLPPLWDKQRKLAALSKSIPFVPHCQVVIQKLPISETLSSRSAKICSVPKEDN